MRFDESTLEILDQTLLPFKESWIDVTDPKNCVDAIKALKVRGAPLIGVTASLSFGLFCKQESSQGQRIIWWTKLIESRPTAVNLMHLMNQLKPLVEMQSTGEQIYQQAVQFFLEDQKKCEQMANIGLKVLTSKLNLKGANRDDKTDDALDYRTSDQQISLLTHCNTGALATAGEGTALAVIKKISEVYPKTLTYVDETRPLLQGARLTAWELNLKGAKHKLICDNMAGFLMLQKKVDAVFVGADRITSNGDSANKIGTYSLAVLCHHHKIPFYIVAPTTTIDSSLKSGGEIPIEERSASEVHMSWASPTTEVYNPAFDWVPNQLITGWITEEGYYEQQDLIQGAFTKYLRTGVN